MMDILYLLWAVGLIAGACIVMFNVVGWFFK